MSEDKPNRANSKRPREKGEKKPPKKITKTYLHNSGLYYLERFAARKNHFRTVMGRKVRRSCNYHKDQDYEECLKLVDELADQFESSGLLDDTAYLRGMITSLRRRGLSRKAIIAKLLAKGLSSGQITAALQTHDEEEYPGGMNVELLAAIKQARKKRLGPFDILQKHEHEKSLATMARAGFSYDIASKVLEMDLKEAEEMVSNSI